MEKVTVSIIAFLVITQIIVTLTITYLTTAYSDVIKAQVGTVNK